MTYKDLVTAMSILVNNIDQQETKLQKKLVKIHAKLKEFYDVYSDKLNDYRLEYAAVDDKGFLITTEKGEYKYTKEGMKSLQDASKELLNEEVDFKPIEVLNPSGLEAHIYLKGWVTGVEFNEDTDN